MTLFFSYLIARIALAPSRNALNAQKQFISNIAHELRTPLTIMKANSEIQLLRRKGNPEDAEIIRDNIEEIDRVSRIINNLLTINTFQHINHMNFQSLDINDIVRDSIEELKALAQSKNIMLQINIDDSLNIWGNRTAVGQITMNLIKNAINYTPQDGSVFIITRALNDIFVEFEVQDTGVGIEPGKLSRIFEPFYKVDPSRSQHKGSGGLGLAIVSELVKLHNGKISIESMPRVGTAIRVIFPRRHRFLDRNGSDISTKDTELNTVTADFSEREKHFTFPSPHFR
jgi:signal transduction histidine kinase